MIRFSNSLTKKKEDFIPLKKKVVEMYNCGPTVYDDVHIGNLRSFVFADILRRTLEFNGFKVKQVMNITDIGHLSSDADDGEDKMTRGLKREGKPITLKAMKKLADFYTKRFENDLRELNVETPTKMPKASENIRAQIKLIKKLGEKGFTYPLDDGIYFDVDINLKNYGKLGGIPGHIEPGVYDDQTKFKHRIERKVHKRNERDFALWKFNDKIGFKSPWGLGFPGWHIECSAMSQEYLGETFDIHTGGQDLIPIHHNNEIAQSENATGKPLARYWLHNEFITMGADKMAKSEGNVLKLSDLKEKRIDPLSFRYWLLTAHYRSPISFSWDALSAAQTALGKIKDFIIETKEQGKINQKYLNEFKEAINDDLNTSKGLAVLWEVLKDENLPAGDKKKTILEMDKVLGLGLAKAKKEKLEIPAEVQELVNQREKARAEKNWQESDRLRDEIKNRGFEVKDTENGPDLRIISK